MIVLLGKQAEEYVALLADLREGRLVRAGGVAPGAASPAAAVMGTMEPPTRTEQPAPLPEIVEKACQYYSRAGRQAYRANVELAQRLHEAGVEPDDIVSAIAREPKATA